MVLSCVPIHTCMAIIRMGMAMTLASRERARKKPRTASPVELRVPNGEVVEQTKCNVSVNFLIECSSY